MMVTDSRDAASTLTIEQSAEPAMIPSFQLPNRWHTTRLLGKGGQASVWLARDTRLEQWVAIKVFHPDLGPVQTERLRREVTLGRSLSHPALVRVFELIELDDRLAVVMEWLPGGSVRNLMDRGRMPVDRILMIAEQVLDALMTMHNRDIVHRDIKPSNLLLDQTGAVRLADLGLARPVEDVQAVTHTGSTPGTPAYMSPEQLRGEKPSPASDLYSLGSSLFHMLVGHPPFAGGSDFSVADKHLHSAPPNLRKLRPDCPRWFARYVQRLLEKRPADRWSDAAAARRAFAGRHSLRFSPKFWRQAVAAAGVIVVGAVLISVTVANQDQTPVVVHNTEKGIVVRNKAGSELWRENVSAGSRSWVIADFLGEGRAQVVIASQAESHASSVDHPEITVYGYDGKLKHELNMEADFEVHFPDFDSSRTRVALMPVKDGEPRPKLLWTARHRSQFPSLMGTWDPQRKAGPISLFANSGHIHSASFADLDDDGISEIVLSGINNALGYQSFVAVLKAGDSGFIGTSSPDLQIERISRAHLGFHAFTVLGPFDGNTQIMAAGRDGITLSPSGGPIILDVNANPADSDLNGMGNLARQEFWEDVCNVAYKVWSGQVSAEAARAMLMHHNGIINEPPMEVAGSLLISRSLAASGQYDAAADLLREQSSAQIGFGDLKLRLGEYLLIAGRRNEGRATLTDILQNPGPGRGVTGALDMLILDSAIHGEPDGGETPLELPTEAGTNTNHVFEAAHHATSSFCRGSWNDPALDIDTQVIDRPELQVFRLWSSLRRGASVNSVFESAESLAKTSDSSDLAILLQSACLVRLGQPQRALSLAEHVLTDLQRTGKWQYHKYAWQPLAHKVVGDAAKAAGLQDLARAHFSAAFEYAPNTWFGKELDP